jgi:energy-coupling factor transporter ATP-binding protein EcfA2
MKGIEWIAIENLRGIREGRNEGFVDVNVLVGKNNCGKSTVVEALLRHADVTTRTPDVVGRSRTAVVAEQRREAPWSKEIVHRRADLRMSIGIKYRELTGGAYGVTYSVAEGFGGAQLTNSSARGVTCFWPTDARNGDIETRLWGATLDARRDRALATALSEIFGMDVEGVQLPPDQRAVLLFADHAVLLDAQGDGARAAFRALTVLGCMKDAPLVLEEPECHQHPASLKRFALALTRLARTNGVQLLVTTHSAECVASFLAASETLGSEAAVFHLSLTDSVLDARKLDAATARTLSESGTDVRFLSLYA